MQDIEQRFINLEIALTNIERTVDDLNSVIIRQEKEIEHLKKQTKILIETIKNSHNTVKPQEEETPPPHY